MRCGLFSQNTRVCGVSREVHSTKETIHHRPSRVEAPQSLAKSFRIRRSEKLTCNSLICNRSKIALLQPLCLPQIRKTGGWGVVMVDYSPSHASPFACYEVGGLSVKLGQPRFGGGRR